MNDIKNSGKDWSKIAKESEGLSDHSQNSNSKNEQGEVKTSEQQTKTHKNIAMSERVASLIESFPPALLEHPSYGKLMEEITLLEKERDQYRSQLLLNKADLDNAHKRFERDLANAHKYGIDKLVGDLVPVIDSLERGLEIASAGNDQEFLKKISAGMALTLDLLLKTLEKYGVKQLNPIGEVFDPKLHEAIAVEESQTALPNTILRVVQKGYLLKDRLLKSVLVTVAK